MDKIKKTVKTVFISTVAIMSICFAVMPLFAAETGEYTVTDVRGKKITFTSVPQRIATTGKPFPSIYFALEGNTTHIVGCHPSSITAYRKSILRYMYPALAQAETGWCSKNSTVNTEELMKLQPDVVFCYSTADKEIRKMEEAGLKVVALRSAEMESIKENLRIMGRVCRKEERAEDLIRYIEEKTAETTSKLQGISEKDKPCIVEFYGDMNVSVKQYDHWMIPSGARNPAASLTGKLADVEMEQILLWNPDIIYIGNHTDLMPSDLLENKQKGRDWSIVSAVKNHRVYKIPIGVYRWDPAGVETPLMIKWAAKIQYPEIFADLDMKKEVREFFKYVYKFELTDEMLGEILDNRQE
jgi:iron complex transport system substrate-binding protein